LDKDIQLKTHPGISENISKKPEIASVLIVDDECFVIELLTEFLRDEGYKVISASSGEEAILHMRSVKIDIVLIDFKMNGMDGLQTVEQIAEIDPDAVAILMTGFPTLDTSIKAIKTGISDYILKPFKLDEVSFSLKKAIKEHELRIEMKNLKRRVSELEKNINEKKESIKINQNIGVITTLEGYSTKIMSHDESSSNDLKK
jgi:DNA-binding NtrC family response regulator